MTALIQSIEKRPLELSSKCFDRKVDVVGTRAGWLKSVYDSGIIEASLMTFYLGNKLIASEVLKHYLKEDYARFHQKTLGLKHFLLSNELVSPEGKLTASEEQVLAATKNEFPGGFVAKPAFDVGSGEKDIIIFDESVFIRKLFSTDELYKKDEMHQPSVATHEMVGECMITGGERYILQEKFGTSLLEKTETGKKLREFRIHAFFDKVLGEATRCRWRGNRNLDEETKAKAISYSQEFLDLLPKCFTIRNAWSFDLLVDESGVMRFSEIQTNFGDEGPWSGALRRPGVLGAYVRYLEKNYRWSYEGIGGQLFHANLGNARRFIKKRIFDNSARITSGRTTTDLLQGHLEMIENIARKYLEIVPPGNQEYASGLSLTTGLLERLSEHKGKPVEELFPLLQKWIALR